MRARSPSAANKKRKLAHRRGILAEWLAAAALLAKGYQIIGWRMRNRGGEIDVIARRGQTLAFVEIKARATRLQGLESITPDKQRRQVMAAEQFIASHPKYACHQLRFDLMVMVPRRLPHHLADAWRP